MPEPSNIDRHPSCGEAQIAFAQAVEALARDPDVQPGQIAWLRRQRPVAIDVYDRVLLAYPSAVEARLAGSAEAMVRLDHKVRAQGLAKGLSFGVTLSRNAANGIVIAGAQPAETRTERPPWERSPVYLPGFLVATTLPHSDPRASEFTRVNGKIRTTLHAPKRIGLPFGVHARLIMIHLATAAVRTQSRHFAVGRSINELLARMLITNGGGRDGQSTRARNQLDRLCATTFTTTTPLGNQGENLVMADRWMEKGPKGREVILGERFFEQATKSAVPLDPAIVRTLRRSPLALDLYAWLTYRMATLNETASVSWPALEAQFGSEYKRPRDFRAKFRRQLARVIQAWPGQLQVEACDRRVVLDPGPPSVASWMERQNAKQR